jgi:hypothetical protein
MEGLLTGCGLLNAGAANRDGDEDLGIHGYLSHIPAEETVCRNCVDRRRCRDSGVRRAARGECLRREPAPDPPHHVTARVGESDHLRQRRELRVQTVADDAAVSPEFRLAPGLEDTEIVYKPASPVVPRDAAAEAGLDRWMHLDAPTPDYAEQCFYHDPAVDSGGVATILMLNRARHLGVRIAYDKSTLNQLTQWKMMGQGEYTSGIEPANCRVMGRSAERAAGRLQTIEPGEVQEFRVTIDVLDGADAITTAEAAVQA